MKKVAISTFGCRANQYDSAVLAQLIRNQGFKVVDDHDVDVHIINTCAITENADREALRLARRVAHTSPQTQIIVTGCTAQVEPGLFSGLERTTVIANAHKYQVIRVLNRESGLEGASQGLTEDRSHWTGQTLYEGGVRLDRHSRSFLKIQDGCSQFCSYCIVPFSRGLNRSIPPSQILEALHELDAKGIREVVLTGIHMGTYGHDLRPRWTLTALLRLIALHSPVRRIRLSSIDPEEVGEGLIELLSGEVFCPHLHLPVQSGDDALLKKMRRRYTAEQFRQLCERLIQKIPELCLGTDVMVGFPGEDALPFARTQQLLQEAPVNYFHVFPFSPRRGTKAALFSPPVDCATIKARAKRLRELSNQKQQAYHERFVGTEGLAILENQRECPRALTGNYISVEIPTTSGYGAGAVVRVKINSVHDEHVLGEIVGSPMELQAHS